jgi:hypothetical protein
MNDDLITSSVTYPSMADGTIDMNTITISGNNANTIGISPYYGSIAMGLVTEDILDRYSFNKITIDHKVQEQELMKLKETVPTYADEIKENLARNMSRDIMKKMTFTKRHDKDTDVHHFLGRVWVFTEEELKNLIEEVKNA